MNKKFKIHIRKNIGKLYNKKLRKLKYIPCIIHNKKQKILIKIKENYLKSIIHNNNIKNINLILENNLTIKTKIKKIQYHYFKDKILHVDFIKIK